MLKVKLKRGKEIVGDIGSYSTQEEAEQVRDQFNTKAQRRGAYAEIHKENPRRNPLGSLFASHTREDESEYSEEEESEYSEREESEYSEEEESEYSEEIDHTYQNPLDLLPIDQKHTPKPQRIPPKREYSNPRESIPKRRIQRKRIAPYALSVQAVMIDDDGYVLIRSPKNKYKGIQWEFYGGTVEGGESLDEALKREISEETGYIVRLVDFIQDLSFNGKKQKFYLVSPIGELDNVVMMETEDLYWVSQDEAWELLGKNRQPYQKHLRSVLDAAYTKWRISNV